METAAACEIARLPEDLLSAVISRTTPRDACRAAAVSPAFRAAADSDVVWSTFLPRDLPPLADGEISPAPPSKKGLFLHLSDRPLLLTDRLVSMWTDRETGAMCYVLSARALQIVWGWGDTWRQCLPWIPLDDSRFSEGAQLLNVCWLTIHGGGISQRWRKQINPASLPPRLKSTRCGSPAEKGRWLAGVGDG